MNSGRSGEATSMAKKTTLKPVKAVAKAVATVARVAKKGAGKVAAPVKKGTAKAAAPAKKPAARARKHVFFFGNGKADGDRTMRDTLGGKGAGLAEMRSEEHTSELQSLAY